MMNNKKGIVPLMTIGFLFLGMLAVYLVLFIPLPAFERVRTIINYFLIVALWILLQAFLIYAYYSLAKLVIYGYRLYKTKIISFSSSAKNILVTGFK